jgi:hypothetical protein
MSLCVGGRVVCSLEVNFRPSTRHSHRRLPEVVLTQFVSPDDEHDVLKTCEELKIKLHRKELVRHVGHLPRIMSDNRL